MLDGDRRLPPRACAGRCCPTACARRISPRRSRRRDAEGAGEGGADPPAGLLHRLPGAADLRGDEAGREGTRRAPDRAPTSAAICSRSCRRSISAAPPWATALARRRTRPSTSRRSKRPIAVMGDGGFWHNGLSSGIGNAVFNKHDGVIIVVDNFYSAATGGQDIPSSRADNRSRSDQASDREGGARRRRRVGADQIDRTYDVGKMRDTLRGGADHAREGAEGHRRLVGVHAQQAAPREAARPEGGRRRQARRAARASASTRTSAPAIMPASACRAARRCR